MRKKKELKRKERGNWWYWRKGFLKQTETSELSPEGNGKESRNFKQIGDTIKFAFPKDTLREGNGTPLQYSCLENPMDGGTWKAAVHGVIESQTRLSNFTFTFHFPALEKEMATHSSVLAWRIPGTGEPGGLPSMWSHRVGHDWSDLAAAAAAAAAEILLPRYGAKFRDWGII